MLDRLENKKEMLAKKKWAVLGVTNKEERFGYRIWKILKGHDYTAYGVNPKYDEIEGEKIYDTLLDLPEKVDVVNVIVNPNIALKVLDEAKEAGIEYIWFQPGSFNDEVIEKARAMDFKIVDNDCVYAILKRK